jgi:hypothetical protein
MIFASSKNASEDIDPGFNVFTATSTTFLNLAGEKNKKFHN